MITLPSQRPTLSPLPSDRSDVTPQPLTLRLITTNTSMTSIMNVDNFPACSFPRKPTTFKTCDRQFSDLLHDESAEMEDYTAPLWLKQTWRVPDGLCGPLVPSGSDPLLKRFYEALQHTLYETGLPETIDMTRETKTVSRDQVTIGILSSPVECMSVLLAGGEQCPGDMLLILSHTWCSKKPSPSLANKDSLYVHQAVAFNKGGYSFLERYDPPRRVTYFVNFLTSTCTGGVCSEGENIEKGLDCPMSSSLKLNRIVDDKLYTRLVLAKAGVAYPTTLAFPYKAADVYENEGLDITVVPVCKGMTDPASKNLVRSEVSKFLTRNKESSFNKLVAKPSGASWFGSKFVSFHNKMDVEGITAAVEHIIDNLEEGDCALVEEYISFEQLQQYQQRDGDRKYNVRIRSTVCRTSNGNTRTTKITCGIGDSEQPINGDNTIPHSLELSLKKHGFSDEQIREIRKDIEIQSERTMAALIKNENDFSEEKRGEVGAQTDVIGIDLILKKQGAKYEVVVIEVNSHDCMINCQIHEFINPTTRHEAAADLVETMIQRSNTFLIRGKTLLIIGVGCYSKYFIFEEANRLGIKVVLVDTELDDSMPKGPVFIQHDLTNLRNIEQIAAEIIRKVQSKQISLDGCVSFWEDFTPIAAAICHQSNLVGSNFRGAMIVKNKYLTQKILAKRQGDIPHFPRTILYTSETHLVDSKADITKAVSKDSMKFPAILKLLYGSSAVGVQLVKNKTECLKYFDEMQRCDVYGVGLGFGSSMMLTNRIIGSEHDVDVIIYKRKLIAAFVSDNGPTRVPDFLETVAVMPSILDEESKNQLISTAYQCCIETGLENGAFNVELMMTMSGPKLLEINGRMGGFYLRDWIKQCYDVDILLSSFLISFGIRPHVRTKTPLRSLVGVMCVPSEHLHLSYDKDVERQLQEKHDNGLIRYNKLEKEPRLEKFEQHSANIAAVGPDPTTAKKTLLDLCNTFQISTPTYNVEQMLSFVPS